MLRKLRVSAQPFGFVVPTIRYLGRGILLLFIEVHKGDGFVQVEATYLGTYRPQLRRGRNLRLPSALKSVSSGTAYILW